MQSSERPKRGVTPATPPGEPGDSCRSIRASKKLTAVPGDATTLRSTRAHAQPDPPTARAGAGAAQPECKIARGGISNGSAAIAQAPEIALGGIMDGAAAAAQVSKIALGSIGDGVACMLEIAFGSIGDRAAGAAHAHKIAQGGNGVAATGPPQLKDPPEIQATTPTHHAGVSSSLSLLADTDFHTDIEWAVNATSADEECQFEIDGDFDDDLPPALPPATTKKGIGGGCSPRKEAFMILKQFIARQEKSPSLKSICVPLSTPTKEDKDDDYYNDELFQDDQEDNLEEDMTYYQVCNTGEKGCPLSAGGVPKPDTSGMTQAKAKVSISQRRVQHKAHTDKMEREWRKMASMGSTSTDIKYSGVLDERLWLMTDVEVSPILIGYVFPMKEILLIRIAEEANSCGCQMDGR